jgi:hypothetical protein
MDLRNRARYASVSLAIALLVTGSTIAAPAKLAPGDAFTPLEADSVTGTHVSLPDDRHGAPFVAIFAFSQKAGDAAEQWSHALYHALPHDVAMYAVADLSRVPGLFRGLAISGIRHDASPGIPEHRDHVLLLTRANVWSQIVPSGSDDDAVIVAVDKTGTVTDIERRAFSDAAAIEVEQTLTSHP